MDRGRKGWMDGWMKMDIWMEGQRDGWRDRGMDE
jgi:hypothetical protein